MDLTFRATGVLALGLLISTASLCQIAQDHPELCGNETQAVPVPPNVTAVTKAASATSTLTIEVNGSARRIDLPGIQDEIQQVCAIPGARLVVFGWHGGYSVYIIDQSKGTVVDSFTSYSPIMSPDHRWLAMRRFYAPQSDFVVSEQYLLYDLAGGRDSNRDPVGGHTSWAPGREIYPVVTNNAPIDPLDVPEPNTHQFRASSFYWSQDSQYLVFADTVQNAFSVVLSAIVGDKITTYIHRVSSSDVCSGDPSSVTDTSSLTLKHAGVTNIGNSAIIVAQLDSAGLACTPKQTSLGFADFKPAESEAWEHRKLKPATAIERQ
jgi:hypothetical protein